MQHQIEEAESLFDPLGSLRKRVEKDVGAELYAKLRENFQINLESQLIRLMKSWEMKLQ